MTTLAEDLDRLSALGATIDREALAERTMRYLEAWTPPGQERAIADMVAADLGALGAEVELDEEFAGSPSVIARIRGTEPGPTMQWHGHLDAIATEHPPARREGDELIARGASDMKGAISANVESVRLLRDTGLPRRGELLLTYHGLHEEGGSAPLIRLIERGIVGDAVMTGELGSGRQLVTASRGLDFWAIEIHRDGRSIHETNITPDVIDPLRVGAILLERLIAIREGLAGGRVTPAGSLYVGMFRSGDYYNRIPTSCAISGTRRHLAGGSHAEVHAELEALVDGVRRETGAAIDLKITTMTDAYSIDPEERVAQALRIAHERLTGEHMVPVTSGAAGNAADFVVGAGVPAVYYGCEYASAHSDRESTTIGQLVRIATGFALATAAYLADEPLEAPALDAI